MKYLATFLVYLTFYALIAFALHETKSIWVLLFLLAAPTFKLKMDDDNDRIEKTGDNA